MVSDIPGDSGSQLPYQEFSLITWLLSDWHFLFPPIRLTALLVGAADKSVAQTKAENHLGCHAQQGDDPLRWR